MAFSLAAVPIATATTTPTTPPTRKANTTAMITRALLQWGAETHEAGRMPGAGPGATPPARMVGFGEVGLTPTLALRADMRQDDETIPLMPTMREVIGPVIVPPTDKRQGLRTTFH
jgi:hypothetical protein